MDTSRYRRETQTRRHDQSGSLGYSAHVPRASSSRVRDMDVMVPRARIPTPVGRPQISAPKRLPPLDMDLPGEHSEQRFGLSLRHPRWRLLRHRAAQATAFSLVVITAMGGLLFSQGYWKAQKVFKGGAETAAALTSEVDPNLLKGEGDGRINVLMLGRGGGYHSAPDLTDTMILASIDPVNHTATMLSIPRDLWVKAPGHGQMKINAAWQTGEFDYLGEVDPGSTDQAAIKEGFKVADATVESVFGVPVHYNVLVDFDGFKQAIDTVNGISIAVPETLVDPSIAWENGGNSTIAKSGAQQLNGKQALLYVRSRQSSSDFARSERQRSVMLALKTKVDTLETMSNPLKISGLVNAFGNNAQTDLSLNNASRLYGIVKKIDSNKITSIGLADEPNKFVTTAPIRGQSAVMPKAGMFNYTDIQAYVRSQLKDGYIVKENAKVLVLNGSSKLGKAENVATTLKSYGYNVVGTGNAPTKNYGKTIIIDLSKGEAKYTKNYLQKRFNVKAADRLPDNAILPNGADFVIIVGSNESTPS